MQNVRLLRKILFYLFTSAYCVFCPILILYSLGYILKPGTEHGIAKTGLIYLSTIPSGASVYLENKRFTEKTPTAIRDLLPGNYRLAVSLKNYRPWSRTVSVEAEKASVFDKILLLPKEWKFRKLSEDEFDDLVPLNSARFFFLTRGPLLEDLFLYDLKQKVLKPVFPENFPLKNARFLSYSMANRTENILIRAQIGLWGEERSLWVDPSAEEMRIRDVTERVRTYGFLDWKIYMIQEDYDLREKSLWPGNIFLGKDIFRIRVFPKNAVFFPGFRGKLLSNGSPYYLAGQEVTGADILENPSPIRRLVKSEGKIEQAFWVYGGSHVLFRQGNKVRLLELTQDAFAETYDCFEVKRRSSVLYFEKSGRIYYLQKNTGYFCETDLGPGSAVENLKQRFEKSGF